MVCAVVFRWAYIVIFKKKITFETREFNVYSSFFIPFTTSTFKVLDNNTNWNNSYESLRNVRSKYNMVVDVQLLKCVCVM